MPRYFNLPHSKVGNVNINRTALTFFVFDQVDAMYATAYIFLTIVETSFSSFINVKVKAKQVRSIRIQQNFLKNSTERIQIQQKWGELVSLVEFALTKIFRRLF